MSRRARSLTSIRPTDPASTTRAFVFCLPVRGSGCTFFWLLWHERQGTRSPRIREVCFLMKAYWRTRQEGNRLETVKDATGVGIFWKQTAAERQTKGGTFPQKGSLLSLNGIPSASRRMRGWPLHVREGVVVRGTHIACLLANHVPYNSCYMIPSIKKKEIH